METNDDDIFEGHDHAGEVYWRIYHDLGQGKHLRPYDANAVWTSKDLALQFAKTLGWNYRAFAIPCCGTPLTVCGGADALLREKFAEQPAANARTPIQITPRGASMAIEAEPGATIPAAEADLERAYRAMSIEHRMGFLTAFIVWRRSVGDDERVAAFEAALDDALGGDDH